MVRYLIWGWAVAFDPDGEEVADRAALDLLAGFVDSEDLLATDYIGGTPEEDAIAAILEPSGRLRFSLRDGEARLRVYNEYVARRQLAAEQLRWLAEYTEGQWSDGMGECLFVPDGPFKDYKLQPLGGLELDELLYPFVHIAEPGHDSGPVLFG